MGNKDDLILDSIRKELQKVNINYNELDEKKKEKIIQCEQFLQMQHGANLHAIESLKEKNYSVNAFADFLGLTRGALYRKNASGSNNYREAILYLNSRSRYFITEEKKLLQQLFRNIQSMNENYKAQIDKFVLRDIEYMEVKKDNKDLVRRINKLEQEKSKLEKENALLTNIKLN